MSQWGKLNLLLLVLLGPVGALADSIVAERSRRQGNWWQDYGHVVSNLGPTRGANGLAPGSRQLPVSPQNTVSVRCDEDKMVVTVQTDLYGIGKMVKASELTLGPQRCSPSPQSTSTAVLFQVALQDCGNSLQMTPNFLVYSTNLTYAPAPRNVPIIRMNGAKVLIQCFYPRNGNVSSKAIKPTWVPFSSTISAEDRLAFSLRLMTDDWSSPRASNLFQLGDIFHIEASINIANHAPMTIYADSCVATVTPDVNSNPRYEIINQNGCLVDGKLDDSSSAFRSPRPQPDKLQFSVDAFRFTTSDSAVIYITCNLRAAATTQVPDPMNKACSFSKSANSWSPLQGPSNICSCCDTGNCVSVPGQSRRLGPYFSGSRWNQKREAVHVSKMEEEEHSLATIGPILVVVPEQTKTQAVKQELEGKTLELWELLALGSLGLVLLAACIAVIATKLAKRKQYISTIQK
ncbi:provisional ortholog of zona pellucida glycoprotein 3 S homeolog precursor [Xenopus laevis]|uniref:Zona pellucida sperm-binding protein 3 n=1 Tax=Xenopus laevis TaxID=8355 RepID=Q91728_XENLA|nr:provisional ortholog of zona pellucida glycoprotein 3 S homeolog precursor [Xenopus laevis]BAA13117.1 gp43 [Xenopus laevis]